MATNDSPHVIDIEHIQPIDLFNLLQEDYLIVDARSSAAFDQGSIIRSQNLPSTLVDERQPLSYQEYEFEESPEQYSTVIIYGSSTTAQPSQGISILQLALYSSPSLSIFHSSHPSSVSYSTTSLISLSPACLLQ
jgi:rhodanese-related sulfurtransferase